MLFTCFLRKSVEHFFFLWSCVEEGLKMYCKYRCFVHLYYFQLPKQTNQKHRYLKWSGKTCYCNTTQCFETIFWPFASLRKNTPFANTDVGGLMFFGSKRPKYWIFSGSQGSTFDVWTCADERFQHRQSSQVSLWLAWLLRWLRRLPCHLTVQYESVRKNTC